MRIASMIALACLAACSSHYIPRTRGRVGIVLQGGQITYVRDGETHPHGFFGSGLQEAVRGNPAAEADAAEYHDRIRDGLIAGLIGAVCLPVSAGYLAANSLQERPNDNGAMIGIGAAIGCTVLMIGGLAYAASAEPYRWDAINRFNDGEPAPVLAPPGYQF